MSVVVDAHFHIWELCHFNYPWPSAGEPALFKDYTIDDYNEAKSACPINHSIFVQVLNSSIRETRWALSVAGNHPHIKGVVAGLDLTSNELAGQLTELGKDPRFVGVRHILDMENETWINRDDVHRGLGLLEEHGKTYDLLLRPHLLKYAPAVVAKFPRLGFIVDHMAKPYIKDQIIDGWKEDISEIAKHPNVYCKISGFLPEADFEKWKKEDFVEYVKHVLDVFGEDRCVYGSDWPVMHLSPRGTYKSVFDLTNDLLTSCGISKDGKDKIFGRNAVKFYKLKL